MKIETSVGMGGRKRDEQGKRWRLIWVEKRVKEGEIDKMDGYFVLMFRLGWAEKEREMERRLDDESEKVDKAAPYITR